MKKGLLGCEEQQRVVGTEDTQDTLNTMHTADTQTHNKQTLYLWPSLLAGQHEQPGVPPWVRAKGEALSKV